MQGAVDKSITSSQPVLLPPDMYDYIDTEGYIYKSAQGLVFISRQGNKTIWAPISEFQQDEEEGAPWYSSIYDLACIPNESDYIDLPVGIDDALKRLSSFGDEVVFKSDRIQTGENYEPFALNAQVESTFKIEQITSIIQYAKQLHICEDKLYLKDGSLTLLVSEESE